MSPFRVHCAFAIACLSSLVAPAPARAEHRVALLIGNSKYTNAEDALPKPDLRAVAQGFEKYGFRCRLATDLVNEYAIRDAIEGFAGSTPTRSTVLLYFYGRLSAGPSLLGADSRGKYALDKVLDALTKKGGQQPQSRFHRRPGCT